MELATLEVTPEEAEARLAEYEAQLTTERTEEDRAILAAYRAAKRGLPIIRLSKAFEIAGRFPDRNGVEGKGLPRLAVIRADAQTCHVQADSGDWVFGPEVDRYRRIRNNGATTNRHGTIRVKGACPGFSSWGGGSTPVPIIPPRHRPGAHRLHLFHVLFEVDSWTPEPSRDPALIRHIRGDLWSVVAVWDLTDIEHAVLAQR